MELYKSIRAKIAHFSELVAFEHTIFSASFILIAMCVASFERYHSVFFPLHIFLLCAISLISARNFAMAFNRLIDSDIDALNPRTMGRNSVNGVLGRGSIFAFCVLNIAIFIIAAYFINDLAFYLSVPFVFIIGFYSYAKRFTYLAHYILGVALALAPISGAIAILGYIPLWCVYLSLGVAFWVAGFDLLYSLQDMDFDRANALHSVPARFGVNMTLYISRISHIIALVFWYLFVQSAHVGAAGYLGLALCTALLAYEQYLVAKNLANIPKAFFVTNGYLGFVFLACIFAGELYAGL